MTHALSYPSAPAAELETNPGRALHERIRALGAEHRTRPPVDPPLPAADALASAYEDLRAVHARLSVCVDQLRGAGQTEAAAAVRKAGHALDVQVLSEVLALAHQLSTHPSGTT